MTNSEKFYSLLKRYKVFVNKELNHNFIDEILVKHVMLPAYERHKSIPFEEYVNKCVRNPVSYLWELSEELEHSFYDIHLINNCFNDKSDVHYGFKLNNNWFFITHRKNNFCIPIYQTEFKIKPKDVENISYLTSYQTSSPNILRHNVGSIKKHVVEQYIQKYIKTT